MNTLLKTENLSKRIGEVRVLDDVSAELHESEVTAFIGPNGAGKTSLFHAITGNMKPDGGRVLLDGRDVTGMAPWRIAQSGVGRVFQDVRVFPNLSPLENVIAALHGRQDEGIRGMFSKDVEEPPTVDRAREIIEQVGVEGDLDGKSGELSFGNQKLLAFARLIAGGFRIALLDEPSAGVSPAMADRLTQLIQTLVKKRKMAIAVIEHNMQFIAGISNRVYVLREGCVFMEGAAEAVLNNPKVRELCLGV